MRTILAALAAVAAGHLAGLALYHSGPFALVFVGLMLSACCALVAWLGPRGAEVPLGLLANVAMNGTFLLREWWYYLGIHRLDIFWDAAHGLLWWSLLSISITLTVALVLRSARQDRDPPVNSSVSEH